jgi:putative spermidine/putrescine transport system permease protein
MTGIVLSHCMFALPFALLPMIAAFESFDFGQVRAAQSLGATPATAFLTVTLPQVRPAIVIAAMFAFAASLEEAVIGLLISGGETTLLSKRIFVSLRDQLEPTVAAVSAVMLAITLAGGLLALAVRRTGKSGKAGR